MKTINVADKETLDKIWNVLKGAEYYGCIVHEASDLNPATRVEYIGRNKDFRKMTMNMTSHEMDFGDWTGFGWLKNIAPCMVKYDGTMDYRLDPDDYTKKADGTASDIADLTYGGNAMVWIPKIYKCEYYIGGDRHLLFAEKKLSDDFLPEGFMDQDGKELEGIWIPMFYGTEDSEGRIRSMATGFPTKSRTSDWQKTAIEKNGSRWIFYGGAIHNTLHAILVMLARSTNSQASFGYGNCSGYNEADTVNYGMKENAVIGGGMFYGSSDQKNLNKIFHSVMLGSYQQYQRDPYLMLVDGEARVSPNYKYDVAGASLDHTGIRYAAALEGEWRYPERYQYSKGFGAVPIGPCKGSTALGYTDGLYVTVTGVRMALRFLGCGRFLNCGLGGVDLDNPPADAGWVIGPPPFYSHLRAMR